MVYPKQVYSDGTGFHKGESFPLSPHRLEPLPKLTEQLEERTGIKSPSRDLVPFDSDKARLGEIAIPKKITA